jgi:hypothetical protein
MSRIVCREDRSVAILMGTRDPRQRRRRAPPLCPRNIDVIGLPTQIPLHLLHETIRGRAGTSAG